MAACAMSATGVASLPAFLNELRQFAKDRELDDDPYHLLRAWRQRDASARLLAALKAYDFAGHVTHRVAAYIPDAQDLALTCDLYFVLTGWKWGDAMFTGVERVGDTFKLSDDGRPTVIINLSLMTELAGRDEATESIVKDILENLVHECFHLAYAHCRAQSPALPTERETPEIVKLVELLQNEGMAHYISHGQRQKLFADYEQSAALKTHERQAFDQLHEAAAELADPQIDADRKRRLLIAGTSGKYWSKFACISGLFMAYHIERVAGREALRRTILGGGPSFLMMYEHVRTTEPSLPQLPQELKGHCRRMPNAASPLGAKRTPQADEGGVNAGR